MRTLRIKDEALEDTVIDNGFQSIEEFHRMICNADISSPEKFAAFKEWQIHDGTKEGLLILQKRKKSNCSEDPAEIS